LANLSKGSPSRISKALDVERSEYRKDMFKTLTSQNTGRKKQSKHKASRNKDNEDRSKNQ
jgi:hypothetical protein